MREPETEKRPASGAADTEEIQCRLTVFFEDPFWVGVFERQDSGGLSAAKVTFGAEPKDHEVLALILERYRGLRFSPAVAAERPEQKKNPKRMQRDISRALEQTGTGTKSQQALKLQQEQNKKERKVISREQKQAEAERMFALKQQKKKEKHRGR